MMFLRIERVKIYTREGTSFIDFEWNMAINCTKSYITYALTKSDYSISKLVVVLIQERIPVIDTG